jgi:hypothetical protein
MRGTARSRGRIRVRLVRQGRAEEAFDDAFWAAMGARRRVEALWAMTLDALAMRGEDVHDEPRLQRSVLRVRRA